MAVSRATILFTVEGDAEVPYRAFSGTAFRVLSSLRARGHTVRSVDTSLRGVKKLIVAGVCFHPNRLRWRARFVAGGLPFYARTLTSASFKSLADKAVVLQVGATFETRTNAPLTVLCDWNAALAWRFQQEGSTLRMSAREARQIIAREARVYRRAECIFTLSEALRQSFIEDFNIPESRVLCVGAGPNIAPSQLNTVHTYSNSGSILFVGKEFSRKGGETLISAFRMVREVIPHAQLKLVGGRPTVALGPNEHYLGMIDATTASGRDMLIQHFREASAFALPTLYEPLGIAILEAMHFSLPCVATRIWAIPEMIVDGETGFLVEPGDASSLAGRLIDLLSSPLHAEMMGQSARARVTQHFGWERAANLMGQRIDELAE